MKPIGGYLALELSEGMYHYHDTPYRMKSGRSSLHYILSITRPSLVHIPYYICNAAIEPFEKAGINYKFYEINEHFEPRKDIELQEGEYFLYVNYLDLKKKAVMNLSERYKDKLIVDCAQSFFVKGNGVSWYFNSCRKFFGVPDGSYLYIPDGKDIPVITEKNEDYLVDHLLRRFNGDSNKGYESFLKNEVLADSSIYAMSKLSEYLLSGVDYNEVIEKRRTNYAYLHDRLKQVNHLDATTDKDDIPIFYPLLLNKNIDRSVLFDKQIYISELWKNALLHKDVPGFEFEKDITKKLWPLPIDHTYTPEDMEFLYQSIKEIIK